MKHSSRCLLAGLCVLLLSPAAQASLHSDIDTSKLLMFLLLALVIVTVIAALLLRWLLGLFKKGRDFFEKPGTIRRP